MGILSIVAGLILLAYPGISVLALAIIVSIWLLVFGLMEISVAWRLRSAATGRARARRTRPEVRPGSARRCRAARPGSA